MIRPIHTAPISIEEQIGEGAHSRVFRGRCPTTSKAVAVKIVGGCSEAEIAQLLHTHQCVSHPHILPLLWAVSIDNEGMIVSPLAHFGSFTELIFDTETLRRSIAQIATALQHMHRQGWIHRDVKPKNLLIAGESVQQMYAQLCDLGLSTRTPVSPTPPVGSPAYMAPEAFLWQCQPSNDWFALGVSLYEILTGVLPFDRPSLQEDVLAKQTRQYDPVPEEWHELIHGLLDPDPTTRFTGREVLAFLAPHAEETRDLSTPQEQAYRAVRPTG